MNVTSRALALSITAALAAALGWSPAAAIDISWSNSAGGNFHVGGNWGGGLPPGAIDAALFDMPGQVYSVDLDADVSNRRVLVGNNNVTLDLDGFTYTLTEVTDPPRSLIVAETAGDTGRLTVRDGVLNTQLVALGQSSGALGFMTLEASASMISGAINVGQGGFGQFNVQGNLDSGSIVLARDDNTTGQLNITGGAIVTTTGTALLGSNTGGSGATALVSGAGTQWNISSQMVVGRVSGDTASLTINAGAQVVADLPLIANNLGSTGSVTVDGVGSSLISPRRIHVGVAGNGTMVISGGATVQSTQATSPSQSSGIVGFSLTGGFRGDGDLTIRDPGSRWTQDGGMSVGFGGDGIMRIENGGELISIDGFISRTASSTGDVTITGAGSIWSTTVGMYVGGDATTAGSPGTLRLQNGGRVATDSLRIHAGATYALSVDALALTQGIDATGAAQLDGTLALSVATSFVPAFGDVITGALDYGTRTGGFSSITGRTLPGGLVLAHVYAATGLELTPTIVGDGNLDGNVTGADFTIWADGFGITGAGFDEGDYNGDGLVTGADFTLWADNFGMMVAPAHAAFQSTVPEPATLGSAALALLGLVVASRRRKCRV